MLITKDEEEDLLSIILVDDKLWLNIDRSCFKMMIRNLIRKDYTYLIYLTFYFDFIVEQPKEF